MWAVADEELLIPISYEVDGELILPTAATVVVRNAAGGIVLPTTTLDVSTTETQILLPASDTKVPVGQDFVPLFVAVRYIFGGRTYTNSGTINIAPFIPMSAGADDVRQILGLPADELPDAEIEIIPSYFRLLRDYPKIPQTLLAGTVDTISVNRAIALQAAVDLIPSLQLRVGKKLKGDTQEFERFNTIDWGLLKTQIEGELDTRLTDLYSTAEIASTFDHFSWSSPTDVITGE
jgi:hypothetical protein